ncbi:MAG: tetratricopeptide repeat protein [Desulfococcaceae bacterium]
MIRHRNSLRAARRATRSFLVYRPDGFRATVRDAKPPPPVGLRRLANRFPGLRMGRNLMEAARGRLQSESAFAVLLIRLSGFGEARRRDRDAAVDLLLSAADALDAAARACGGFWGLVEQDLFGLFLPAADGYAGRLAAEAMRNAFGEGNRRNLAIGLASHPLPGFGRPQTFGNARKALDHAELIGPDGTAEFNAVSLHISGDRRYQRGDVRGAIAEFKQALTLAPDDPNLLNSLGVCYGVRGALDAALKNFEESARLAPEEMMPVYNAGMVHRLRSEPDLALEKFDAAIAVGGIVFEAVFQAGRLLLETGAPEAALERFRTAAALRPRSGIARRFLAEALLALDREDEAMIALGDAVRRNPGDALALSALGERMDLREEDPEIALLYCRHSVELAPKNGECHLRLGDAFLRRGMAEEALAAYERAARLGADCADRMAQLRRERRSRVS